MSDEEKLFDWDGDWRSEYTLFLRMLHTAFERGERNEKAWEQNLLDELKKWTAIEKEEKARRELNKNFCEVLRNILDMLFNAYEASFTKNGDIQTRNKNNFGSVIKCAINSATFEDYATLKEFHFVFKGSEEGLIQTLLKMKKDERLLLTMDFADEGDTIFIFDEENYIYGNASNTEKFLEHYDTIKTFERLFKQYGEKVFALTNDETEESNEKRERLITFLTEKALGNEGADELGKEFLFDLMR